MVSRAFELTAYCKPECGNRHFSSRKDADVSRRTMRLAFLISGAVLGSALTAQAQDAIDYETQIQPIFTVGCAVSGCHTGETLAFGGFSGAGLILLAEQSYGQLVGLVGIASKLDKDRLRVVPGNSAASLLMQKLESNEDVGPGMPLGGDPLPAETLQLIRDWIDQGALPGAATAISAVSWGTVKETSNPGANASQK